MDELSFIQFLCYFMIVAYVGVFYYLVIGGQKSPYGRYNKAKHFMDNVKVYFPARVGWVIQESPSFLVPFCLAVFTDGREFGSFINKLILSMFMLHYFQRTFFYSLMIRGGKESHLIVVATAFTHCALNGYIQGRYFTQFAQYPPGWAGTLHFQIGTVLFAVGMAINIHSDHILRNLRKPGETGYKIPKGGLFEYVSCANFTGEILEWIGYAVASWSLPGWAFAISTILNTGPRSIEHHRWYRNKFGSDYPRSRKAFIPFIL